MGERPGTVQPADTELTEEGYDRCLSRSAFLIFERRVVLILA